VLAPSFPHGARTDARCRLTLFALGALATLAFTCSSAEAVVSSVGGVTAGVQPREEAHYWAGSIKLNGLGKSEFVENSAANSFGNDPNRPGHPGPVVHSVATYAIYWDPQDYYHGDWQELIDGYLAKAGAAGGQLSNVFAVDAQYTDVTDKPASDRSSFRGAYTDTDPYPSSEDCTDPHPWQAGVPLLEGALPVCLTDGQLRTELQAFIAQHSLPHGMGTIFYLLTPPGVTICLDAGGAGGHCSDFAGNIAEIASYEEARANYPEQLAKYEQEVERHPQEVLAYEEALAKYEREKEEKEENKEPFTAEPPTEPVEPVAPTPPTEPAGYVAYKRSFCSYHAAINPDNAEMGDGSTVLYAALPWIAGGAGDDFFAEADQTQGVACQDGGFMPGAKPGGELLEKEREKARTRKEEEEFEKKTPQEKREAEEAHELGLERPHEQEPNQLMSARGPDGYWDHGLPDLIVNQLAVEQQDIVTDPLLNGWQDSAGSEVTDECRNSFYPTAGGSVTANPLTRAGTLYNQTLEGKNYYLNDAFNLAATRLPYPAIPCLSGIVLEPKFTAPNPVGAGETVGFDGMESYITLDAAPAFTAAGAEKANYAVFAWSFGDGSPAITGYAPGAALLNSSNTPCNLPWLTPCAASAFHSYQYGGTYDVTLTVTDVGGNTASVTKPITVVGPPRPAPSPSASSSGSGSPASGSSGAAGSAASTGAPTLAGSVLSRSLSKAVRLGLALRYTVNEQVAGRAEALLDKTTATRLHVKGLLATGLPTGYPREVVVGTAVLVTTRAGQGTVRIRFAKAVAKRLAKAHKLKLTLRFTVRSATPAGVRTTTTLSTVVLSH
jgi:hypothetical protein